ncbi:MAG: rubredoxin-like domain-containing protein [Candidatus Dojkabacteria bacterium]
MENTLNNVNPSNSDSEVTLDPAQVVKDIQSSQVQEVPEDLDIRWLRWKCLVCGYVYEGATPLKICPKCGNEDPDKFDDAE